MVAASDSFLKGGSFPSATTSDQVGKPFNCASNQRHHASLSKGVFRRVGQNVRTVGSHLRQPQACSWKPRCHPLFMKTLQTSFSPFAYLVATASPNSSLSVGPVLASWPLQQAECMLCWIRQPVSSAHPGSPVFGPPGSLEFRWTVKSSAWSSAQTSGGSIARLTQTWL